MTPIHDLLARAAEVEKAATEGPWEASDRVSGAVAFNDPHRKRPMNIFGLDVEGYAVTSHRPDADFIALSRTLMAPLLAVARAADALPKESYAKPEEKDLYAALAALAAVRLP